MCRKETILIIANPASNRGRGARMGAAVEKLLREADATVVVKHTTAKGDAERMAREAALSESDRPGCIVACGGDGTIQEIANALAPLREKLGDACPVMGLSPTGRCNDFARALSVPVDAGAIAKILLRGRPREIDLGRVNGRYFCTVATLGIDAEVSRFVDEMRLPIKGTAAYLYGALRVLYSYRAPSLRLKGDFGEKACRVFLASSANTSSYGGSIPIAPDAVPTDGLLDICIIEAVSRLRALTLIPAVLRKRHERRPEVHLLRTRTLQIESDTPLELWADGERISQTPATIEIAPAAIKIMLSDSGGAG